MLAFRPFDTNDAAQQSFLGMSPPSKKSQLTPSKDPIEKNMLYEAHSPNKPSGFRFDLQSVVCGQNAKSTEVEPVSKQNDESATW